MNVNEFLKSRKININVKFIQILGILIEFGIWVLNFVLTILH
jgi:hypothetical protein